MRFFAAILALSAGVVAATASLTAAEFPTWAYPVNPPAGPPATDDGSTKHVPHSTAAFTRSQLALRAPTIVPDWHPDEHPAMPDSVARGREPLVYACGYCHLPSGAGRPENASLAGLSAAFIKQQMLAFRNDERLGSEPQRLPQTVMIAIAKAVTDAEIDEAAAYFASIKPASFVTVIETVTVPKTIVAGWTFTTAPDGGTEPLGARIIEMPESFEQFENRDSRTPYVAYVPLGSIARGEFIVTTGGGGRFPLCVTCHGPELRGLNDVPRLAGRSPSYLFRQLYDVRGGTRKGASTEPMKLVVATLTDDEMIAIAAYLASCAP
jgi:cytochrome c553